MLHHFFKKKSTVNMLTEKNELGGIKNITMVFCGKN